MATKTFDKIAGALAHLAVVRQATEDAEIRDLCMDAASTIKTKVDDIVILDGVDPAADLRLIKFDPLYDAINECNSIADKSSSPTVKGSCLEIVESLTAVIKKLI